MSSITLVTVINNENLYLTSTKYNIGDTNVSSYESDDKYITKIAPGTTLESFKENIVTNGTVDVILNGTSIDAGTNIGTGMILKIIKDSQTINITLVVTGDIDESKIVTITDLSMLNQQLTGRISLTNERLKAADLDYNGKISITDLSRLNQYLIKQVTSL